MKNIYMLLLIMLFFAGCNEEANVNPLTKNSETHGQLKKTIEGTLVIGIVQYQQTPGKPPNDQGEWASNQKVFIRNGDSDQLTNTEDYIWEVKDVSQVNPGNWEVDPQRPPTRTGVYDGHMDANEHASRYKMRVSYGGQTSNERYLGRGFFDDPNPNFPGYDDLEFDFIDAEFSQSQVLSGDPGLTVNFTDNSKYSPATWHWNFGCGHTSNQQNPSHTYTNSGVFNVTLTVNRPILEGNANDSEIKNNLVEIYAPPIVLTVSVSGVSYVSYPAKGQQFTKTWTANVDPTGSYTYKWYRSINNGPSYEIGSGPYYSKTYTYQGPGTIFDTIKLSVKVTNSDGDDYWGYKTVIEESGGGGGF